MGVKCSVLLILFTEHCIYKIFSLSHLLYECIYSLVSTFHKFAINLPYHNSRIFKLDWKSNLPIPLSVFIACCDTCWADIGVKIHLYVYGVLVQVFIAKYSFLKFWIDVFTWNFILRLYENIITFVSRMKRLPDYEEWCVGDIYMYSMSVVNFWPFQHIFLYFFYLVQICILCGMAFLLDQAVSSLYVCFLWFIWTNHEVGCFLWKRILADKYQDLGPFNSKILWGVYFLLMKFRQFKPILECILSWTEHLKNAVFLEILPLKYIFNISHNQVWNSQNRNWMCRNKPELHPEHVLAVPA